MPETGIWDTQRVLDHLNVVSQTLRYYRGLKRGQPYPGEPFPEPFDHVNGGPIWMADEVIGWNERRRDHRRSPTNRSEP